MSDEVRYQLSHGLDVLHPKSSEAYPIPCEEWTMIRSKIEKLTPEPWFFQSLGMLLLGTTLSTVVTIVIGTFQLPTQQIALVIAVSVVAITFICGLLCLYFAYKERGVHLERATDVLAQMDVIETRYEHKST